MQAVPREDVLSLWSPVPIPAREPGAPRGVALLCSIAHEHPTFRNAVASTGECGRRGHLQDSHGKRSKVQKLLQPSTTGGL